MFCFCCFKLSSGRFPLYSDGKSIRSAMLRSAILTATKAAKRASCGGPGLRRLSTKVDSFLTGSSSVYVEQMYDLWRTDPKR